MRYACDERAKSGSKRQATQGNGAVSPLSPTFDPLTTRRLVDLQRPCGADTRSLATRNTDDRREKGMTWVGSKQRGDELLPPGVLLDEGDAQ